MFSLPLATVTSYSPCSSRRLPGGGSAGADLVDLVGDHAVRLTVHRVGRVGVRCLDETEDRAGLLVDPEALVVDAVIALDREVSLVRLGHVVVVDRPTRAMNVHVERHSLPLRFVRTYAATRWLSGPRRSGGDLSRSSRQSSACGLLTLV